VRMARLFTGRTKVLAAYRSYHGATAIHDAGRTTGARRALYTSSARICTARISTRRARRKSASAHSRASRIQFSSRAQAPLRRSFSKPSREQLG
jgi:4-aminobutyrate aminotransferase-like enzyme